MTDTKWESYEEVAAYLLNQIAAKFGLERVEGKQSLIGKSGATWEIDAKGVVDDNEAFILIECRRYTTSKLKQEHLGGLAYRIIDTKAKGGIIVTPLGLQEGAEKVARKENITSVILKEDSTTESYMLQFLNNVYLGVVDYAHATDVVQITVQIGLADSGSGSDTVQVEKR